MSFQRIAYKVEPVLHIHRYIVAVICLKKKGQTHTKYHYCVNRDEVRAVKAKVPVGAVVEVYRASHNFLNAWERTKK